MRNNRKVIAGMIAAAALAASGSLVYAQADKPADGSYQSGEHRGPMGHERHEGHRGHGQWSNPAAAVEGHLAALKVELKITPNQETAWQAFAAKSRQQSEAWIARRAQRSDEKPAANVPAPERLAQRTAHMKQMIAGMEARTAAVSELYAVLTPEQKTIADKQFSRGFRHGHHGRHGGHEHGHHFKNKA